MFCTKADVLGDHKWNLIKAVIRNSPAKIAGCLKIFENMIRFGVLRRLEGDSNR